MTINENKEFIVFGFKVNFRPTEGDEISPSEIVKLVQTEADEIVKKNSMHEGQLATLVALKLAGDKLKLEKEYRHNVSKMQTSALDALRFIEEVSPNTL